MEQEIKHLMKEGMYDQNEIFRVLYPYYVGHYSKLREEIAKIKNGMLS